MCVGQENSNNLPNKGGIRTGGWKMSKAANWFMQPVMKKEWTNDMRKRNDDDEKEWTNDMKKIKDEEREAEGYDY